MTNRTRARRSAVNYAPHRTSLDSDHGRAYDALTSGTVVYAIRQRNSLIKIGCTANLIRRRKEIGPEVLAFRPGTHDDEQAIHRSLRAHVAKGREYYHPTPEVFAVINAMRDDYGLPHIAA